jgi:hypothetical protein
MSGESVHAAAMEPVTSESVSSRLSKPWVLVALFFALAIGAATLPSMIGYGPYGQQAIDQQIDNEEGALCEKFEFATGTRQHSECKLALADLRRHHELLLIDWGRL